MRPRALSAAVLAAFLIVAAQSPAPAAAASPADRVISISKAQRGDPWRYGATGPRAFDCSGLVLFAFGRARQLDAIGNGRYRSGSAMLRWARAHDRTTRNGRRGDIAVWGNGSHVGIYLGNGRVISTLVSGVRVTGVRALTTPFTTFIRTGLSAGAVTATGRTATTSRTIVGRRTVAVAALNLRTEPGLGSRVKRTLDRGTRLGVIRSTKDVRGRTWYRVEAGSRVGWVAGWLTRPVR